MVTAKPITQLNIFCLIQDIINYVQINTYWDEVCIKKNLKCDSRALQFTLAPTSPWLVREHFLLSNKIVGRFNEAKTLKYKLED
jgi:hypothetical protein